MEMAAASKPAGAAPNDDGFVTGPGFAVVLDGATAPTSRDSGCVHDVPWLVAHLSGHVARLLYTAPATDLTDVLTAAISATCDDHRDTCDLSNPDSPSTTITIVRIGAENVDYLVLGDSPLAIRDPHGAVSTVIDDRVEHLPDYSYDSVARLRNHPDGFWIAAAEPAAAAHALRGSVPRAEVARLLLLTDGASRLVERYGWTWPDVLAHADKEGPWSLLRAVHAADATRQDVTGKRYDDATAVLCRIADTSSN